MATVSEITEPATGDTGGQAEARERQSRNTTISGSGLTQLLNGLSFWKKAPTYPYSPIDSASKEIRVLDLQPGKPGDKVRCTLRKVSLLDDPLPVCETISYTWGDSSSLKTIGIDKYDTAVPSNTEEVLRRFRKQNRVRTLWIDAVCINQNSPSERQGQVGIMGQIYKKCARNLIWLGDADMAAAWASKEAIEIVLEDMRKETDDYRNTVNHLWGQNGYSQRASTTIPVKLDFLALAYLYSRPWFSRLWEAVLPGESICCLGKVGIPLLKIARAAAWLRHKIDFTHLGALRLAMIRSPSEIWVNLDSENGPYADGNPPDLLRLLNTNEDLRASEPKDYVFGLLGIYLDSKGLRDPPLLLQPDYSKSLVEVMRDATIYVIQETKSFNVFSDISHRARDQLGGDRVPSWVPKWHRSFDSELDSTHFAYDLTGDYGDLDVSSCWTNPNCLIGRGVRFDKVGWTTKVMRANVFDRCRTLSGLFTDIERKYRDAFRFDIKLDLVASALMGTRNFNRQTTSIENYRDFLALRKYLRDHVQLSGYENELESALSEKSREAFNALLAIRHHSKNRRFFITANGHIGTGPQNIKIGDTAAVIHGCWSPVILHRYGTNEWKMAGPCYIPGIVAGEALQKQHGKGGELEEFHIW